MKNLPVLCVFIAILVCDAGLPQVAAQRPPQPPTEAIDALESTIESNRRRGVETKSAVYYHLASAYLQTGRPAASLRVIAPGLEVAGNSKDDLVIANLILLQSVALNQLGRSDEGVKALRRGLAAARRVGNQRLEAKLENELGSNLFQLSLSSDAVAAYGRAIQLANQIGAPDIATPARLNLVSLLAEFAEQGVAIHKLEEMLAATDDQSNPLWRSSIELNLASALAEAGRLSEARKHIRNVQKLLRTNDNPFLAATAWFNLSLIHEQEENIEAAASCLEAARFQAEQGGGDELLKLIRQKLDRMNLESYQTLDVFITGLEDQLRDSPSTVRRREIMQALTECETLRGNWMQVTRYQAELYQLSQTLDVETVQAEVRSLLQQLEGQQVELQAAEQYSARLAEENRFERELRQSQLETTRLSYGLLTAVVCVVALLAWVLVRRAFVRRWTMSQKEVERVLRTSNSTWQNTFDALDDAVCTITAEGKIKRYNQVFKRLFGASLSEGEEVTADEIVNHYFEDSTEYDEGVRKLRFGTDGFEKWFRLEKPTLHTANDDVKSILVIRDVSADIKIRDSMSASQRAAEDATKVKSEFVAIVSHELRTPLAAICGASDLIQQECELTAASEPLFKAISSASSRLSRLIDDLLDYSSIDRGKLVMASTQFCPADIAEDCLRPVRQLRPDLDISLDVCSSVQGNVLGDDLRYSQILTNLLTNAERATAGGRITVRLEATFPTDKSVELKTVVEDTGVGIPFANQEQIFEPFEQASCSDRRRNGGAGLGLAICRSLARAMGGDISMSSTEGVGSVFTFRTCFMSVSDRLPRNNVVQESNNKLRVLVVDDDDICRLITARLVKSLGHEVSTANSGLDAVEQAGNTENRYDIVIMDLMMPGMTGFEAAAKIRTRATADNLPIYALTAKTSAVDRQTSRSAGINAYLVKPVTREKLAAALADIVPFQPDCESAITAFHSS